MKAPMYRGNFASFVLLGLLSCCAHSPPAAAQCEPEKSPDNSKPTKGSGPVTLRYAWQPNTKYKYRVTIEAELPDRKLTFKGTSIYHVRDVQGGQCTLLQSGSLQKNEVMKPQARSSVPRFPGGFPQHLAFAGRHFVPPHLRTVRNPGHELTINERGAVLKIVGENSLPLLLGDLALLPIEPLPEKREKSWTARMASS